ncbi:hypothetical protein Efla_003704 [Eimeria flavescens]
MVTRRGCGDAGILMRQQLSLARWSPIDARPSGISSSFDRQKRLAHKFAAPECPNLLKLRMAIEQNFQPICFYVKNDYAMGHHVYDQHFYGILCSPVFEGKTYGQINAMVDRVLEPIGLKGRVKLHCQPPSRFEKMRHRVHWRWQLEK